MTSWKWVLSLLNSLYRASKPYLLNDGSTFVLSYIFVEFKDIQTGFKLRLKNIKFRYDLFYKGAIFSVISENFIKIQTSIYNCMHQYNINSENERQSGAGETEILQILTHIFPYFVTSQWRHNNRFWILKPAYIKLWSIIVRMAGQLFLYLVYFLEIRAMENCWKLRLKKVQLGCGWFYEGAIVWFSRATF